MQLALYDVNANLSYLSAQAWWYLYVAFNEAFTPTPKYADLCMTELWGSYLPTGIHANVSPLCAPFIQEYIFLHI